MKNCDENLFSDNVESSLKKLWKMISADVRINVKQKEMKKLKAGSYTFL